MTDFQKGMLFMWVVDLVWEGVIFNVWKVWREVKAERRAEELTTLHIDGTDDAAE